MNLFPKLLQSVIITIIQILKKMPLNILHICICAISLVQMYLNICSVNMWHPNIFGYLFVKLYGIRIYIPIFVRVHLMIFAHHGAMQPSVEMCCI